jgi:catechol-2,3-dioxygenase
VTGGIIPCVIETALYVDDLERAADFYLNILGLRRLFRDNRLQAFSVGGKNVLLLFRRGASLETTHMPAPIAMAASPRS